MSNLHNWKEITKGLYRFVVGASVCYEIHILYHETNTDILNAKSSLYLVGDWIEKNGNSFFQRECLSCEKPLIECLKEAERDFKENMK